MFHQQMNREFAGLSAQNIKSSWDRKNQRADKTGIHSKLVQDTIDFPSYIDYYQNYTTDDKKPPQLTHLLYIQKKDRFSGNISFHNNTNYNLTQFIVSHQSLIKFPYNKRLIYKGEFAKGKKSNPIKGWPFQYCLQIQQVSRKQYLYKQRDEMTKKLQQKGKKINQQQEEQEMGLQTKEEQEIYEEDPGFMKEIQQIEQKKPEEPKEQQSKPQQKMEVLYCQFDDLFTLTFVAQQQNQEQIHQDFNKKKFFVKKYFYFNAKVQEKTRFKQNSLNLSFVIEDQSAQSLLNFKNKKEKKNDNIKISLFFNQQEQAYQALDITQYPFKQNLIKSILKNKKNIDELLQRTQPFEVDHRPQFTMNFQQIQEYWESLPQKQQHQMKIQQGPKGNCYYISTVEQIVNTYPWILDQIDVSELSNQLNYTTRSKRLKISYFCFVLTIDGVEVPVCCSKQLLMKYAIPQMFHARLSRPASKEDEKIRQSYYLKGIFIEKAFALAFKNYKFLEGGWPQQAFMMLAKSCCKVLCGSRLNEVYRYIDNDKINAGKDAGLKHMFVIMSPPILQDVHQDNINLCPNQRYQQSRKKFAQIFDDSKLYIQEIDNNSKNKYALIQQFLVKKQMEGQTWRDFLQTYIKQCIKFDDQKIKNFLQKLVSHKKAGDMFNHSYSFDRTEYINDENYFVLTDSRSIEDNLLVKWNIQFCQAHKIDARQDGRKIYFQTAKDKWKFLESHQILISQNAMYTLNWTIVVAHKYKNYRFHSISAMSRKPGQKYYKIVLKQRRPFFIVLHQNDQRFRKTKYTGKIPDLQNSYASIRLQLASVRYILVQSKQNSWIFFTQEQCDNFPKTSKFQFFVAVSQLNQTNPDNQISLISSHNNDSIEQYVTDVDSNAERYKIQLISAKIQEGSFRYSIRISDLYSKDSMNNKKLQVDFDANYPNLQIQTSAFQVKLYKPSVQKRKEQEEKKLISETIPQVYTQIRFHIALDGQLEQQLYVVQIKNLVKHQLFDGLKEFNYKILPIE